MSAMNPAERMAALGTDKELNDLLDFSAMFLPPSHGGPGRGDPRAVGERSSMQEMGHGPARGMRPGMEEVGGGPWSHGPSFESSRGYPPDGTPFSEGMRERRLSHDSLSPPFITSGSMPSVPPYPFSTSRDGGPGVPGMSRDVPLASPNSSSPFYPFSSPAQRRPLPEPSSTAKRRKGSGHGGLPVYSPSSSDEFNRASPSYTSPKPSGMYGEEYFSGAHSSPDPWGTGGVPSAYPSILTSTSSHIPPAPGAPFSSIHHNPDSMGYGPPSLPPMNTFRGSSLSHNSSSPFVSMSSVNSSDSVVPSSVSASGSTAVTSQSSDALGKALASIYSEPTSSSFPSNPSTPAGPGSPPALTGPTGQWSRPTSRNPTSPPGQPFESHLHALQSRVEERLDDAIHVLRNHAATEEPPMGSGSSLHPMGGLLAPANGGPFGPQGPEFSQSGMSSHLMGPGAVSSSLPGSQSVPTQSVTSSTDLGKSQEPFHTLQGSGVASGDREGVVKVEKVETKENVSKSDDKAKEGKEKGKAVQNSKPKKSRPPSQSTRDSFVNSPTSSLDEGPIPEDETPEERERRERDRRAANNARERLRVRDINEAFRELGRMCSLHLNTDKPQTKLTTLHQAVEVITDLERQVRERNLNPKAACLKRREEEKVETSQALQEHAVAAGAPASTDQASITGMLTTLSSQFK
ncbi:transcription factor 12-like [Branchiostoma floridae x Branchiostoma belcheri]